MKLDDILHIICKLEYCCDDYKTIHSLFETKTMNGKYEVNLKRENGRLINFEIGLIREVPNEKD